MKVNGKKRRIPGKQLVTQRHVYLMRTKKCEPDKEEFEPVNRKQRRALAYQRAHDK